MTLRELLSTDPVARAEHEVAQAQVNARFGSRVPEGGPGLAFRPFVEDAPWRYWDASSVDLALALLERDVPRSIAAVVDRAGAIDRGIDGLFRRSARGLDEGSRHADSAGELVTLATEWILRLINGASALDRIVDSFEPGIVELAKERGLDWARLSDEERERLVDDILHE